MSYDYNALVGQIASSRRLVAESDGDEEKLAHLQQAVDTFSNLSTECPMTPLLWMQYSADTAKLLETLTQDPSSAVETRLQMLELALSEFPGSAILHVHYLQLLCAAKTDDADQDKVRNALDTAIENVGRGSHRNEAVLVAAIYRLAASFRAKTNLDSALQTFYQRARVPMKDVNESLNSEFQTFCQEHEKAVTQEDLNGIDEGRRYEAKTYSVLVTYQDEVDAAMHNEGILPRHQVDLEELTWETILRSDEKMFWMGFGGMETTNAFIQYAQTCYRYRLAPNEDEDTKDAEEAVKSLALCVYERGVAECPTVEPLWLSYIRHLLYLVQKDDSLVPRLRTVVDRSVRNCPYSLPLIQQKLNIQLLLANLGKAVLDPDEIMKSVQDSLAAKFITSPEACLELQMTAIQVIRRRILSLLASSSTSEKSTLAYDDEEPVQATVLVTAELDDASGQEVEDLCDDIREMYDSVDSYLRKHHTKWSDGRSRLWSDRAFTETHLLGPLADSLRDETTSQPTTQLAESIRCYGKLSKVHQPSHPDSFSSYIQAFLTSYPSINPRCVLSKIRQARSLYQKALKSVGKPKDSSPPLDAIIERDYETALRNLCHEYLVFERYFGSDKSLTDASKDIQKKLTKLISNGQAAESSVQAFTNGAQEAMPPLWVPDSVDVEAAAATTEDVVKEEQQEEATEQDSANGKKRPVEQENDAQPAKKTKVSESDSTWKPDDAAAKEENDNEMVVETPTESPKPQPPQYKVKVGKLEYPAHPLTVRVSNLAADTEDMELVDTFRPKCGAIVHAKIIREKHHNGKGKSKGWGLLQFEDRESVEKALALSEVVGIREKLVKVDRSHMPAVGLVPPGMHRVNPKGAGKSSKQNQKRKQQKVVPSEPASAQPDAPKPKEDQGTKQSSGGGLSVLAFRPRGVQQSQKHRKVKISLSSEPKTDE
jgi:RNA recognition motif-containing protein